MAGEDFQSFQINPMLMGMGGPAAAPAATETEAQDMGYPTLQSIAAKKSSFESFSKAVKETVGKLESAASAGPSADDARAALKAYDHMQRMVALIVEITIAEVNKMKARAK